MSKSECKFRRALAAVVDKRLREPRRFLQVVSGPRQVGKTTLVLQVVDGLGMPFVYASADEPAPRGPEWMGEQWEAARAAAGKQGAILVLDEVQKAIGWAESVKRFWDEDTRKGYPVKVVLLSSAPLLVQRRLSESLAGRFEILHLPHWSYAEMRQCFGFTLDQYVFWWVSRCGDIGGRPPALGTLHLRLAYRNNFGARCIAPATY